MSNSFGLSHIWVQGDWVTRGTMLVLLFMSVLSWTVIIVKACSLWVHRQYACKTDAFWQSSQVNQGLAQLGRRSPFYLLVESGVKATEPDVASQTHLTQAIALPDWVERCLRNTMDKSVHHLQSYMVVLASIGATAPFIGLFGTVWGIYHALLKIGMTGQATMDQIAGPVGETLIMTALGLVVAIPAVLGYNALLRGNKLIIAQLNHFANDLHIYLTSVINQRAKS